MSLMITFTYNEESNGTIPFLDPLINCQPDGNVFIQIYWKWTHTE